VTRRSLSVLYRRRRLLVVLAVGVGLALGLGVLRGQAKARTGSALPGPTGTSSSPAATRGPASNPPSPAVTPSAGATVRSAPPSDAFRPIGSMRLNVPLQNQLPELPNGCEVTSLSMLLRALGTPVSKLVLADEQPTNHAQPVFSGAVGDFYAISRWTNPNTAFVGNVRGKYGYGIYHAPLAQLLNSKAQGRALDLSGRRFSEILDQLRTGTPIVLWTTTTFRPPSRWVTWSTPQGPFRATQLEHAVLLVGYSRTKLIINNPLTGRQQKVAPAPFIEAWQQMGRQALTYSN
jgi:uncharacterized protein YvpB